MLQNEGTFKFCNILKSYLAAVHILGHFLSFVVQIIVLYNLYLFPVTVCTLLRETFASDP